MKKIIKLASLLVIGLTLLVSCQNPVNTGNNSSDDDAEKKAEILRKKIEVYNKWVGTTWELDEGEDDYAGIKTIVFADDSVTLGNYQYSLNKNTDLFFNEELPEAIRHFSIFELVLKIGGDYYGIMKLSYTDEKMWFVKGDNHSLQYSLKSSAGGSGTGGSGSGNNADVNGTYKFTNATGSQNNGNITLDNGNWTYTGDRTRNPNSGTYTTSGNEITLKWVASGYDVTETFTLTDNGDSVTWKSKNDYVSSLFSSLFGVANTLELTFTKE